jgi:hypothetical protein
VTSIWRVTARYIENFQKSCDPSQRRCAMEPIAGTAGRRPGNLGLPSSFQHSFALRRTRAVPVPVACLRLRRLLATRGPILSIVSCNSRKSDCQNGAR